MQKPQGEECQTTFTCAVTPAEGPFAHGTFEFIIQVPRTYPFSPPSVKCLNKVFHQNFDFRSGAVYLPFLTDSWRPVLTMNTVIFFTSAFVFGAGFSHFSKGLQGHYSKPRRPAAKRTISRGV